MGTNKLNSKMVQLEPLSVEIESSATAIKKIYYSWQRIDHTLN